MNNFKCARCKICNGHGCLGQLPGLGGVFDNKNFILNCSGWEKIRKTFTDSQNKAIKKITVTKEILMCAPVTGANENIGYQNEQDFYEPYLLGSFNSGIGVCVGDGTPDDKLKYGIQTISKIKRTQNTNIAFFLKPYSLEILKERINWANPYADYFGIDIDAYNILTMRNKVKLIKHNVESLTEFRKMFCQPLVIKGVFTSEDIKLVQEVRPEVIYISNHGGRVETEQGSTAEFLYKHGAILKNYCKQLWVDGGVRSKLDVQTAVFLGADRVLLGRPLIRACFDNPEQGIFQYIRELLN